MKKVIFLLLLFTLPAGAQELIFQSPLTQTSPEVFPSQFEEIDRILYFDSHSITITTVTSEGKEFESFDIQEISSLEQGLFFFCLTGNEEKITIIIPHQEKIEIIDLYRRSPETGEELCVRFHVD
ncbi:hypothetical protein [Salinimicrobium sp. GXAS 041]|uniref:hypothetical protein n=1 Tax=Salinimicrobium sp. GXAS 041 TaxID=3400806 RepID=UPI003C7101B0